MAAARKLGEAGIGAIISINRGKSQGVEAGQRARAVPPRHHGRGAEGAKYGWTSKEGSDLKLPNERYGLAFVFRVFDRVSYALVMQASRGRSTSTTLSRIRSRRTGMTGAFGRSAPPE